MRTGGLEAEVVKVEALVQNAQRCISECITLRHSPSNLTAHEIEYNEHYVSFITS